MIPRVTTVSAGLVQMHASGFKKSTRRSRRAVPGQRAKSGVFRGQSISVPQGGCVTGGRMGMMQGILRITQRRKAVFFFRTHSIMFWEGHA